MPRNPVLCVCVLNLARFLSFRLRAPPQSLLPSSHARALLAGGWTQRGSGQHAEKVTVCMLSARATHLQGQSPGQCFSTRTISHPRGHLAMSGGILDCHYLGQASSRQKSGMLLIILQCTGQPHSRELSGPNVNSHFCPPRSPFWQFS